MAELTANGRSLDMPRNTEIKYTKQIADVFDLSVVSSSFATSFDLPKTPENTQALQQLGIVGDVSTVPYSKVVSTLSDNGFPLIKSGWLNVKSTDDKYKVSVIDGMIDFFKAIESKTMGSDLNLSIFEHEKNLETVIDSFDNPNYKYAIADYNGRVFFEEAINIDYLVPSFNMGVLFKIVMDTFGFSFSNLNIEELNDFYLTYPKDPAEDITTELIATLNKGYFTGNPVNYDGTNSWIPSQRFWDSSTVTEGTLLENWRYVFPEDSDYNIELSNESYAMYTRGLGFPYRYRSTRIDLVINGNVIKTLLSNPFEPIEDSLRSFRSAGDVLEFRMYAPKVSSDNLYLTEIRHNSTELKVTKTSQGSINLQNAFKDFLIKDFIKECFWITAVTPIIDNVNNHISFISLENRIDFSRAIDWSDKFIKRTNESYNSGYAQKNVFKHKYNDTNDISSDGYLYSDNKNAPDQKIIVTSKLYAPEEVLTIFSSIGEGIKSFYTRKFRIWNTEVKESSEGVQEIEYKGLKDRFYLIKIKTSETASWPLTSIINNQSETVLNVPYADIEGSTYSQIVPKKYAPYNRVLNNFRSLDIDLAVSINDYLSLDLTRPYYLRQEAAYFMFNRLNYQSGKVSSGEFIKINTPSLFVPVDEEIDISIIAYNPYSLRLRFPVVNGFNEVVVGESPVSVNDGELQLQASTTDGNVVTTYISIPVPMYRPEPLLQGFEIKVTDGLTERIYTYNDPDITFSTGDQSFGTSKTITATVTNG